MTKIELKAIAEYSRGVAYKLGLQDAKQGRVYRHSANPGSWVREWLIDYEQGWQKGRER